MKPSVISANANASSGAGNAAGNSEGSNAIHVPINREFPPHFANAEANANSSYGSPNSQARQPSHQIPQHFQQDFGFEPDMDIDMDMFPRGRLGRIHRDPFSGFGGSPDFGFPEFGSMGRRRRPATDGRDDDRDFFNRLPSEFRQYIPEGFGHRRGGSAAHQPQQQMPSQHHQQQHYPYHGTPPNNYAGVPPQSPSKKVCDAAIQTEDPASSSHDQVDHAQPAANLNQHGLRNTVDMGVKATPESEQQGARAHSAPPPEQMQQHNNSGRRATPPQQSQFGTQTSPQASSGNAYQKAYYPPQQQPHPQQKQQTPPPTSASSSASSSSQHQQQPQTPGGTYIRTIPIFVEGRSEPIINAHKEIPNQYAPPQPNATHARQSGAGFNFPHPQQPQQHQPEHQQQQQHHNPQHQHQQRPTPLNTQQQPSQDQQQNAEGVPPQTPHTLDSINKIQDIQRDVLDLMGKVEKFTGTRRDKEYVYLDEMLTRNLLKLDTIDTNGKESIRLARKEAIKCIQASINVLEAKAEENAKTAKGGDVAAAPEQATSNENGKNSSEATTNNERPSEQGESVTAQQNPTAESVEPKVQCEPIPLPPPSNDKVQTADNVATKEASPKPLAEPATESSDKKDTSETK